MAITATIILSLVLSWILWHRLREIKLASDLDKLNAEAFDLAYKLHRLDDPAYLEFRYVADQMAQNPQVISLPLLVRALMVPSNRPPAQISDADFEARLAEIRGKFGLRVFAYTRESVIGVALNVLLLLWPFGPDPAARNGRIVSDAAKSVVLDGRTAPAV